MNKEELEKIKQKALQEHIPIIMDETLEVIEKYLKEHFIKYFRDSEDGTERITMIFKGYDKCSDEIIEACIYFFSDSMECRVYYNETGAILIDIHIFLLIAHTILERK